MISIFTARNRGLIATGWVVVLCPHEKKIRKGHTAAQNAGI